jgi:histidinol-phosphatase (PHP family)
MKPFSDYHTHPQGHRLQPYDEALLQPWADSARARGLTDIALTDHDRYHAGVDFDALERARAANPDLNIRAGIELDVDPASGAAGRQWVERHWDRLDFVLGSVHHLQAAEMFDSTGQEVQFAHRPIDEIYADYFQRVQRLAESGVVDCLSHLDLVKIHGHRPQTDVLALAEPLLQCIRARGLAMEISTAGWRKPVGEIYPEKRIIRRGMALGIPFTTASDAHSHVQLGENYDRLGLLLDECGITEVAVYERHRRTMVPLSRR